MALLVALFGWVVRAQALVVEAKPAVRFYDSIGVNTHVHYTGTLYDNYPLLKSKLQELGVRNIRDGFDPSKRQYVADRFNDLAAVGIKTTFHRLSL